MANKEQVSNIQVRLHLRVVQPMSALLTHYILQKESEFIFYIEFACSYNTAYFCRCQQFKESYTFFFLKSYFRFNEYILYILYWNPFSKRNLKGKATLTQTCKVIFMTHFRKRYLTEAGYEQCLRPASCVCVLRSASC